MSLGRARLYEALYGTEEEEEDGDGDKRGRLQVASTARRVLAKSKSKLLGSDIEQTAAAAVHILRLILRAMASASRYSACRGRRRSGSRCPKVRAAAGSGSPGGRAFPPGVCTFTRGLAWEGRVCKVRRCRAAGQTCAAIQSGGEEGSARQVVCLSPSDAPEASFARRGGHLNGSTVACGDEPHRVWWPSDSG